VGGGVWGGGHAGRRLDEARGWNGFYRGEGLRVASACWAGKRLRSRIESWAGDWRLDESDRTQLPSPEGRPAAASCLAIYSFNGNAGSPPSMVRALAADCVQPQRQPWGARPILSTAAVSDGGPMRHGPKRGHKSKRLNGKHHQADDRHPRPRRLSIAAAGSKINISPGNVRASDPVYPLFAANTFCRSFQTTLGDCAASIPTQSPFVL
jgi:hypothetical protein